MGKKVLILAGSPRKGGNSDLLCDEFARGAEEAGHKVEKIYVQEQKIGFCRACDVCMRNGGACIQKDDMEDILCAFQQADVVVLATPVYFYGVSAQMKACIDRTYPIWQHLGRKEVYYIVSAGLGEDIIARSLGDLDGFVEHFEQYEIKGRLYAPNVMEAGAVRTQPVMEAAYQAGLHV